MENSGVENSGGLRLGNLPGRKSPYVEFSGVEFSVWRKLWGGKRLGGNIHDEECSRGETTGVEPSWGNFPGGHFPGGNLPVTIGLTP